MMGSDNHIKLGGGSAATDVGIARNSAGQLWVTDGQIASNKGSLASGPHVAMAINATDVPLTGRGTTSQSGNLQTWQSSTSTVLSYVDPNGYMFPRTFTWVIPGPAVVGTAIAPPFQATQACRIMACYATCGTAPTGASLIFDILQNGTSIWSGGTSNRVAIAASATTGTSSTFTATNFAATDVLTFSVIQVGSTVAGSNITVQLSVLMRNN